MGKKVRIGLEGLELATMDMTTESDPYYTISTTLEEMCKYISGGHPKTLPKTMLT